MGLLIVVLANLTAAVWFACWLTIWMTGKDLDLGFLGALIGAAGTIFAATIAYVAVQKQIDQAEKAAADQAAQVETMKETQRHAEASGFRGLVEYCERLEKAFAENLQTQNAGNSAALESVRRAGLIIPFNGNLPADIYGQVNSLFQRLNNVSIVVYNNSLGDAGDPGKMRERAENDRTIADIRDELARLHERASTELAQRK